MSLLDVMISHGPRVIHPSAVREEPEMADVSGSKHYEKSCWVCLSLAPGIKKKGKGGMSRPYSVTYCKRRRCGRGLESTLRIAGGKLFFHARTFDRCRSTSMEKCRSTAVMFPCPSAKFEKSCRHWYLRRVSEEPFEPLRSFLESLDLTHMSERAS